MGLYPLEAAPLRHIYASRSCFTLVKLRPRSKNLLEKSSVSSLKSFAGVDFCSGKAWFETGSIPTSENHNTGGAEINPSKPDSNPWCMPSSYH